MKRLLWLSVALVLCFFLSGCGGGKEEVFTISDLKNPEVQLKAADLYLDGPLQKFKEIKRIAIAEFTICYLTKLEDQPASLSMQVDFSDDIYADGADILYDLFAEKLKSAGYEIVPKDQVLNNADFQALVGKPAEDFRINNENKAISYRLAPVKGFKVTGGGLETAANALAQADNQNKYARIAKAVSADATITVHLLVGQDKGSNLLLAKNVDGANIDLIKAYVGINDDGNDNVLPKDTIAINLKKPFRFDDMDKLAKDSAYEFLTGRRFGDANFKEYLGKIYILLNSLMDTAITKINS